MLIGAVSDGVSQLLWEQDTFAFVDTFDEGRYVGVKTGQMMPRGPSDTAGLVVKSESIRKQLDAEVPVRPPIGGNGGSGGGGTVVPPVVPPPIEKSKPPRSPSDSTASSSSTPPAWGATRANWRRRSSPTSAVWSAPR